MEDKTKNVAASQTMWGAGLAVVGAALAAFGVDLGVGLTDEVATAVGALTTAFGAVWVIVERWKRGDLFVRKPKA